MGDQQMCKWRWEFSPRLVAALKQSCHFYTPVRRVDMRRVAIKAVARNKGKLVDLLSLKAFWRITSLNNTPLNTKGDLFRLVSIPYQNLTSKSERMRFLWQFKTVGTRKTSPATHLHAFSHKAMMIKQRFKGIRLWSSLKGLIDHFTRRTWQASWAACRAQGEGHLHEEAALSGGSPDATLPMSYSTCLWSTKQNNTPPTPPYLSWLHAMGTCHNCESHTHTWLLDTG